LVPVDVTGTLGSGEIVAPPGVRLDTQEQRDLYRATAEFERFFLNHMVKQMTSATNAIGENDSAADATSTTYRDMANDQLVQSMLDGGGLGIAATLYDQLATAAGIATPGGAA
jgi:Rod binding domain-containing protein